MEADDFLFMILVLTRSLFVQSVRVPEVFGELVPLRRQLRTLFFCTLQVFLDLALVGGQLSQFLGEGFVLRAQILHFCVGGVLQARKLRQVLLLQEG